MVLTKLWGAVGEEIDVRGIFYPNEIRASKDYVNNLGTFFSSAVSLVSFWIEVGTSVCAQEKGGLGTTSRY